MSESLSTISRAYSTAECLKIDDLLVTYESLRKYSTALCKLEKARDEGSLGLASWHLDNLKSFYWTLLSNLLPYSTLSNAVLNDRRSIVSALDREQRRNISLANACAIVAASLQSFESNSSNPLAEVLAEEIATSPSHGTRCIVLADYHHLEATRQFISRNEAFVCCEISTPSYLRDLHFYDEIYLVGAPRRFERDKWLITSPRAPCITSVRYSWLSSFQQLQTPFTQQSLNQSVPSTVVRPTAPALVIEGPVEIPDINWQETERLSEVEIQKDFEEGLEDVPAKLHALAGTHFVFLSTDVDAKVLSLDLDRLEVDDEHEGVAHRVKTFSLAPGDYIVLRTAGGRDAVAERANAILGREAGSLRRDLDGWKTALRQLLVGLGASELGLRLERNGSRTTPRTNVKNWCSNETIKPQSFDDFVAIMKTIGRESEAVGQWTNAEKVLSAHRESGHQIRKALILAVQKAELSPLKECGVQLFELAGSGSLTAYQVENIAPNVKRIPHGSLNRVFRLPSR